MPYIDRDKLDRAFTALRFNEDGTLRHWGDRPNWCMNGREVEELINSIPTADVQEVKHGKWIWQGSIFEGCWVCSECEQEFYQGYGNENYCPNCGTGMESREDPSHPFADSVMMGERSEDD